MKSSIILFLLLISLSLQIQSAPINIDESTEEEVEDNFVYNAEELSPDSLGDDDPRADPQSEQISYEEEYEELVETADHDIGNSKNLFGSLFENQELTDRQIEMLQRTGSFLFNPFAFIVKSIGLF